MNTDFPLKAQDAIIGDVIIYPEMDMSRTDHLSVWRLYRVKVLISARRIPNQKLAFYCESVPPLEAKMRFARTRERRGAVG